MMKEICRNVYRRGIDYVTWREVTSLLVEAKEKLELTENEAKRLLWRSVGGY